LLKNKIRRTTKQKVPNRLHIIEKRRLLFCLKWRSANKWVLHLRFRQNPWGGNQRRNRNLIWFGWIRVWRMLRFWRRWNKRTWIRLCWRKVCRNNSFSNIWKSRDLNAAVIDPVPHQKSEKHFVLIPCKSITPNCWVYTMPQSKLYPILKK
jgi:hypothetical protein